MTIHLHFLVEGRSEFNFVNQILKEHFQGSEIILTVSMLTTKRDETLGKKHSGGAPPYKKVTKEIKNFLGNKSNQFRLTTMIDLYKFPDGFPRFESLKHAPQKRIEKMEKKLYEDFDDRRFIPYIQLHEYEALLFANPLKFLDIYTNFKSGIKKLASLSEIISPEEINDGENTAPSKRIINEIPKYAFEKSSVGANVAKHIGLDTIRAKCPHFSAWIDTLESLANSA